MDRSAVKREGVRLSYLEGGSGEQALLFIHGWCCDGTLWRDQTDAFAPRHRIIAVDLRGHGDSDKPEQDYTIAGFAEDVAWLCRELELERPVIVGHSMGGVIALNVARRWPGRNAPGNRGRVEGALSRDGGGRRRRAHFIHLEKPEELNAILRRFIEALP